MFAFVTSLETKYRIRLLLCLLSVDTPDTTVVSRVLQVWLHKRYDFFQQLTVYVGRQVQ